MTKVKERTEVLSQRALCDGIFDLRLKAPQIAAGAVPGQFVNVYLNDAARLLPRPISICGADASSGELRLVYRVTAKGAGTDLLSSEKAGFITGENICIDGGMTRQMIYHGEHGWEYRG